MAKRNSNSTSKSSSSVESSQSDVASRASNQPNARQESSRSSDAGDAPGTFGVTDKPTTTRADQDKELNDEMSDSSFGRDGDLSDDAIDSDRSDR